MKSDVLFNRIIGMILAIIGVFVLGLSICKYGNYIFLFCYGLVILVLARLFITTKGRI